MTEFSWTSWHWHPDIITGLLLLGGSYLMVVGPLRRHFGWARSVPYGSLALFLAGLVAMYIAISSPLHELSDGFLFSAHMVQHLLLIMLVPPLLIFGTPEWIFALLLRPVLIERCARFVTSPVPAFILFSGVLSLWHLPALYDATLRHHSLHVLEHLLFISTAVIMWWPVLGRVAQLPRPPYPIQMIYLFFLSLPPGFLGAVITFSKEVKYRWYTEVPRLWGLSALADQQIGGLIMKLLGAAVFLAVLGMVFFTWYNREETDA